MTDLTGRTLANRYRVDAFIGRGGMAEVYKVWDTHRNTALAVKLLHADLALDRAFLRRFKREAQTLARLQHPHIVRFYGLEQDGEYSFMVMDFIEGKSLKHRIFQADGPMPLAEVIEVMRPLCQALGYAHNEGFVHADVKPGNILIKSSGRVMLTDFGIARMTETATVTMIGAGTPAYMSPEQARGEVPTPRSDIYSLGILLYEMLTGERPFNGEHARTGNSTGEKVRWEQINLQPPSPRKFNPKISAEVEAVVLRALAKEPRQRYASALELMQAFETACGAVPGTQTYDTAETLKEKVSPKLEAARQPEPKGVSKPGPIPRRKPSPAIWIGGIVLIISVFVITLLLSPSTGPVSEPTQPFSSPFVEQESTPTQEEPPIKEATATVETRPTPAATNTSEPIPTATALATATATAIEVLPTPVMDCENDAEFVADVTVPDGTEIKPGQEFVKTWQIKNTGSCTWSEGYTLIHVNDLKMDGVAEPILRPVSPGEVVEVSVRFRAPEGAGEYISLWQMTNNFGIPFGNFLYVNIVVR